MKKINLISQIHRSIKKIINLFKNASTTQKVQKSTLSEENDFTASLVKYNIASKKFRDDFSEKDYTVTIIPITENSENVQQLLQYCIDHPGKYILLTANPTISKKAKYLSSISQKEPSSNVRTLQDARRIGGKLIISEFNTKNKNICVISRGREIFEGPYQLNIGDEVFIATKKREYCTFSHFRIISFGLENNCVLVYHTQLHNMKKINNDLPRDDYQEFVRNFKIRHDM